MIKKAYEITVFSAMIDTDDQPASGNIASDRPSV